MLLSEIEEYYLSSLREATRLPSAFVGEGALIVYARGGEPPAYTLYIATLHAGLKSRVASAVEASTHILPYRDVDRMILFTLNPRDSRALNTVITASLLGVKTTLVSPPLHEAHEEKIRMYDVEIIKVDSKYPLLTMTIAALHWTPKLMGFREGRIRGEISSLQGALRWVYENYVDVVERGDQYDMVAYTPSTRPGAYYYARAKGIPEPLPLEALNELPRDMRVLAMMTTTEEHSYRDLILSAKTQGVTLELVTMNTDPITATLYSMLLALLIVRKPL